MTDPVVEVRRVGLTFRRGIEVVHALRDVSVALRPGELAVVMGPSGSGKTSLIGVICGWEEPDSGEVAWGGQPVGNSPRGRGGRARVPPWSTVAAVPQTLGLLGELTIEENVQLPLRLAGTRGDSRPDRFAEARDWMDRLGIAEVGERLPAEVSLGQQQRAALARALLAAPHLLVADEPSAHLDSESASRVYEAMKLLCSTGTASLVATHDPTAIASADRVLTMHDGSLQEPPAGSPGSRQ